jgi:hypothetical protein
VIEEEKEPSFSKETIRHWHQLLEMDPAVKGIVSSRYNADPVMILLYQH